MGSFRSKEDDVNRISISIFVTNFPVSFTAKDLFHSCKMYGHVVDSYIPAKRSKEGKRFGFVRFINVFNVDRLVESIRGGFQPAHMDAGSSDINRVKEFASLSNLKTALSNEGFCDINVRYIGELWVLLEFVLDKSKYLFRENVGAGSLGWIPDLMEEADKDDNSEEEYMEEMHTGGEEDTPKKNKNDLNANGDNVETHTGGVEDRINSGFKEVKAAESVCSGRFKQSEVPRKEGSFLSLMEEVVKVRQTMGYNMEGEVVLMGDFNEVRFKSDRFGSIFNAQGANDFNSFITNAGLEEVQIASFKEELRDLDALIDNGDIVNEVQSAFIAERQIMDDPFILNEIIQWCKLKKKQSLIFKVDFEKAFDSVRWDFLDDVLKNFSFRNKWCNRIQACLKSSRGSILVNGSPTDEFQFFKGLKQVNPLSLFLFILTMESLHLSFQRVINAGLFLGINLNHSITISHLFYADDAMFVGVHVEDAKVKHAASKLGCLTLKCPFTYLGTKVGGSMSWVEAWKDVVDKVNMKLSKWKMKALSIGESIRSRFFNGHEVGSNKASWVRWNHVLAAKDNGGLGVSSLYALNRGLLLKWVWRFFNQKDSLWAKVVRAIHGDDINKSKVNKLGAKLCWSNIMKEIRVLSNQGVKVLDYMRLKLGNREMAAFWADNWSDKGLLRDLFPRLYTLENDKLVSICSKLNEPHLDVSFRRTTRGGAEQVQFNALLDMISYINLVPMADRWVWTLENLEDFSVASIREKIDEKRLPIVCSKTRWVRYVPIKVNMLAWKIKIDALPTISRRGIDIQSITCPVCDNGVESLDHLFFRCCLARQISQKIATWWNVQQISQKIATWWNVQYVKVDSYEEWLAWLASFRLVANLKRLIEGVFYVSWWSIWTYRNKFLFDDKAPLKESIFDNMVSNSFHWCSSRCKTSFSWNEWLKNMYLLSL
nr:RNA-directed DNA polymerase, eukaryota, reverse transcriptase zinc-binding domain protein [Tanacetum cinerariifolium]